VPTPSSILLGARKGPEREDLPLLDLRGNQRSKGSKKWLPGRLIRTGKVRVIAATKPYREEGRGSRPQRDRHPEKRGKGTTIIPVMGFLRRFNAYGLRRVGSTLSQVEKKKKTSIVSRMREEKPEATRRRLSEGKGQEKKA